MECQQQEGVCHIKMIDKQKLTPSQELADRKRQYHGKKIKIEYTDAVN